MRQGAGATAKNGWTFVRPLRIYWCEETRSRFR